MHKSCIYVWLQLEIAVLRRACHKRCSGRRLYIEVLEVRQLFSASLPGINLRPRLLVPVTLERSGLVLVRHGNAPLAQSTPSTSWFTPAQIRQAYGMNQVTFGSITGDGTGQTIAIIDAYHYPTAFSDLKAFDLFFGLPDLTLYTGPNMTTPYFRQVAQDGTTNFPTTDPAGRGGTTAAPSWEMEEAMDIEWAHSMAPRANILLVEANSNDPGNLDNAAVNWARQQPGVSVVSMSFGTQEFFNVGALYDSDFSTPAGHNGVTFVASSGDDGAPPSYPALSVNVVGVGGTTLTTDAQGNYTSETAWSGSGGGISAFISKPSYQSGVTQSATFRTSPDVSLLADPNTGVAIFDSYDFPGSSWLELGGTSLAAPMFSAMIAVADQGRNYVGLQTLDGPTQTLPMLYSLPSSDFHDITSGSNGTYNAGPGYDLVTGLGSPIGNKLIASLVGVVGSISGRVYADNNNDGTFDAGDTAQAGVPVFLDANGNGVLDTGGTITKLSSTINYKIPDNNPNGTASTLTVTGLGGLVTKISVNFSISHARDSDLTAFLIGPDGTQVALFPQMAVTGANFSNTTLVDSSTRSIVTGTPPFTGTFQPSGILATFDGKLANGNWKLKVADNTAGTVGTLVSWSIVITTGPETSTVTGTSGTYSFNPVIGGSYNVLEVPPTGFIQAAPTSNTFSITGLTTGIDFVNNVIPFTTNATNSSYYVWSSQNQIDVGTTPGTPLATYPAASAPHLAFNLALSGSTLIVNFSGGSPIPLQNIAVNGSGLSTSQVTIIGAGSSFTMTDTQIIAPGGGQINFSGLGVLDLKNSIFHYTGNLATLDNLIVDSGTTFYWN